MSEKPKDITQEDINNLYGKLEGSVSLFTSQVTAQADKAKKERVDGIVQLAIKAGKTEVYTAEKLSVMEDSTLQIVENSLNDLIKALEEKAPAPDTGGGVLNPRGEGTPAQVSHYELIDGLSDMISHAFGIPILDEALKQEVRFEHIAAGLEY